MVVDALSQLLDVILDDLSARFIINLPEEELSSVTRICFGLEQAHWFYEDFFRPQHPTLPSVNLRAFTAALFSHCPLLWKFSGQHEAAFDDFLKYKTRVPVRGAIMLNREMSKCVLVKGWKASASWGFPKGKIDQGEEDANCAVREVLEECGFDVSKYLKADEYIDMVMREQTVRLYVVTGVPLETKFEPQTRKEISKIDWFALDDLPTYKKDASKEQMKQSAKYYMVAPFVGPLRKWIKRHKSKVKKDSPSSKEEVIQSTNVDKPADVTTELDVESSSQALKLLLGIVDAPPDSGDESFSDLEENNTSQPATQIDLDTLFQKPAGVSAVVKPPRARQQGARQNSVNTGIETSILDQLGPIRRRHSQSLPQSFMNPLNSSPPAFPPMLPPTTSSYHPPVAESIHRSRPQESFGRPIHQHPFPAVQQLHYTASPPRAPMIMGGPSGFNSMDGQQQPMPPSHSIKTNPNASSLLAILNPRDMNGIQQNHNDQKHDDQPQASVKKENIPLYAQHVSGPQEAGLNHKLSLLSLLKPSSTEPSGVIQSRPALNNNHPNAAPISEKDAFLLNYLEQAADRSTRRHRV